MATPGRIVAALAAGTQETTLTLAQINFDFSLVKFEAPESFHGLGNLLSKKRKVAAECGLSHVTARKLGALFEQLLPKTPRLIDTYGLRASEIAKIAEGGETVRPVYGIFADQAGVDATSIWAAATSGSSAIAMHLLACMLARMFPGPEATSIWAELIDERKKELNTENPTDSHNVSSLLAAHITISRDLLAEWDNSARAWLRVADEAKSLQQTQLLLILKNIHVPVNHEKGNLYHSVIGAWIRALELMEKVLCGASQCVTPYQGNGDLLLALASWHIYPDMNVFGNRTIAQNDSLVPSGAVLTVGLECSPAQQDIGIFWSLPLAHYRFYGAPKVVTRSLCTDSERICLIQFVYVTLGSFLSRWNFKDHEVSDHTKLISRVYDYLAADHDEHDDRRSCCRRQRYLRSDPNWFKYLAEACKGLASCSQVDGKSYNRLVGVGIRRGSKFLGTQPPLFGLSTFDEFFALLRGTEAKIAALRRLIDRYDTTGQKLLIRYRNSAYSKDGKKKCPRVKDSGNFAPYQIPFSSQFFTGNADEAEDVLLDDAKEDTETQSLVSDDPILPSIFAWSNESAKKKDESVVDFLESGKLPDLPPNGLQRKYGGPKNPKWENVSPALLETYDEEPRTGINMVVRHGMVVHLPDGFYSYASAAQEDGYSTKRSWEGTELKNYHHTRWVALHSGGFEREKDCGDGILELVELPLIESHERHIKLAHEALLEFQLGDARECALFATEGHWTFDLNQEDIVWAVETNSFDRNQLFEQIFTSVDRSDVTAPLLARKALATVLTTYSQFSKATIALKVIERPLMEQSWALQEPKSMEGSGNEELKEEGYDEGSNTDSFGRLLDQSRPFDLSRSRTFALLATFESGVLNPDPAALSNVMAMSSGDSIFVAAHLLVDPLDSRDLKPSSMSRIRGNIGKPGIAMLLPPPELQVRPRNSASWQVINHTPFDGNFLDAFDGTSLHLSFTEYSRPMDVGIHGVRDADIYFLEAYVQVYFKGQWIGDVNIVSSLESEFMTLFDSRHASSGPSECCHQAKNLRAFRLIAIDNWDEFVDSPDEGMIVRAKNNWLARLAAASLSSQMHWKTIVMRSGDDICWPCVRNTFDLKSHAKQHVFIC